MIYSINDNCQFKIYTDTFLHIYKIYPLYFLKIKENIIKIFLVFNKRYVIFLLPTQLNVVSYVISSVNTIRNQE